MINAKKLLLLLPFCLLLQGCAIVMSSTLPVARPPERLNDGLTQQQVDRMYGAPIAAGMSAGGAEYVEQIQFVNGTPIGRKVMRIVAHSVLDALTCFIWELPGTFIEAAHADYPEETYFVIYDAANRVVRAVPADSPEGQQLAALPWASKGIDLWTEELEGVNRVPTADRRLPAERLAPAPAAPAAK